MIIRKMTIADYDSVYDLWLNTAGMGLNNLDDSRQGIEKFIKRNPETCFVAEKDNSIIGVILCGHDGRRGFIYHTAVSESERRRGVGSALVDAVIDALKKEGISKAALVVFSKNEPGNSFWEKRGFTARQDLVYRNKTINELLKYL
jgi:ribosomal protein S18 acetylase RimI-like enzyme